MATRQVRLEPQQWPLFPTYGQRPEPEYDRPAPPRKPHNGVSITSRCPDRGSQATFEAAPVRHVRIGTVEACSAPAPRRLGPDETPSSAPALPPAAARRGRSGAGAVADR